MKLFGWKSGRDESRPVLSRSAAGAVGGSAFGEWPRSYEAQVREAYLDNPIAQRAVKLVVREVFRWLWGALGLRRFLSRLGGGWCWMWRLLLGWW